ncbi:DUF3857 domain-containing protein [Ferruginibacter sp. SUN002]|uniref:DUF3857 domain-containing protein n=1 Tax=Ferruginibacter sp. SUN002 TaxID=2937789 RepID=UPI003D362746
MKLKSFCLLSLLFCAQTLFAQNSSYEKAWQALNDNKRAEAEKLLEEAKKDPATATDAYITNVYLQTYNGKEKYITDFGNSFYKKASNPYPYIYALWFNEATLGNYGKKDQENQLSLIEDLTVDQKAPGTIVAAANYQRALHSLYSNEFDHIQKYYDKIGSIKSWQYVGPFENISKSGYFKNFGPLEHPEETAVFKSSNNADIKWFTPPFEIKDGWIPLSYPVKKSTAVVYAQNFITSDKEQTIFCNVGFSGSIKVWINDELVIAESDEKVTEMDAYTVKCDLQKGVNRILVQLGYTSTSYPNFCVRFTDEYLKPIPGITGSSKYAAYPKKGSGETKHDIIPHFAAAYFNEKINQQPDNLVNYLLLTDVYLRNGKIIEARNLINTAIKKAPDNAILKIKLIEILNKEDNRTLALEEIEKIKQVDPESLAMLDLNIKDYFDNEKYEDAATELQKRIDLHGEDQSTEAYQLLLLIHDKKYEEMIKAAEKMYKKYPSNSKFVSMMYNIKKDVYKDNKGAMKVYENYLKDNFHYDVYEQYSSALADQGNTKKAIEIKQKLIDLFPYDSYQYYDMSKEFYMTKQFDKAESYVKTAISLAPYTESYWEKLGDIKMAEEKESEAIDAYNRSLQYDPNQYSIINKLRKLNGKSEPYKLFKEIDIDKTIKDDKEDQAKNTDYGYYYILDQKDVILYPGGASEEYYTIILKITNDKGVDKYKESSIGYDNSQDLLIEKAEVIKKNKSRIEGERTGNEIVFTNLEAGDVLVFKYRLQRYVYGRFAKEYWDKYIFGGQIYSAITRYNLLVPSNQKIQYEFANSTIKPVVKDIEDFKQYSWEMLDPEPQKDEPLMPELGDVGTLLHISTISTWKEIADWYSDVAHNRAEEDFEITNLYKKLFPDSKKLMTQYQKAKIIYDYIEANIRYSSVSFRQSAYVPQPAATTLTTRLGDCKDLSSLFVTLAKLAGINAQMVLVDTRDNGEKDILLPSVEFNHCIAKAMLDGKPYYIELTDNYLPFASLPNNLTGGALILEIPEKNSAVKSELQVLNPVNRGKDIIKRIVDIKPIDNDLNVSVRSVKYGNPTSGMRNDYLHQDTEKQAIAMEKIVAGSYVNNVKLDKIKFDDLAPLNDSVTYSYSYKVKNEVAEIGSLKTFRINYPDIVASLGSFSAETRSYPIEYWRYEEIDTYETIVNITAPAGKKFVELPTSETLTMNDMKFTLQYTLKAPDKLVVTRKFTSKRKNIPASDYATFKLFFEKIVKAEQKFIAYK